MTLALLCQLLLSMFQMLIHPSSGACDYYTQNVQEPQDTTRLQEHTHSEPHTTHNIGITLTTR